MKLVIEVDDEEVQRLLGPLLQQVSLRSTTTSPRLLTVKDVAQHLRISTTKVYELVYRGEIHSITIGRSRRVSPAALADFIARPPKPLLEADDRLPSARYSRASDPARSAVVGSSTRRTRERPRAPQIDLTPTPNVPSSSRLTEAEWAEVFNQMVDSGWPADVVEQMRKDTRDQIRRHYALTINDAARYLGLSRHGIEKLVMSGRVRAFTIAPRLRDQKAERRIPAIDILALK